MYTIAKKRIKIKGVGEMNVDIAARAIKRKVVDGRVNDVLSIFQSFLLIQ
jgi:hypothetical protein